MITDKIDAKLVKDGKFESFQDRLDRLEQELSAKEAARANFEQGLKMRRKRMPRKNRTTRNS